MSKEIYDYNVLWYHSEYATERNIAQSWNECREQIIWCQEHEMKFEVEQYTDPEYDDVYVIFNFKDEADAVEFKLVWM